MKLPHFFKTLHFRISALFLLLLVLSAAGYYLWINATVFSVDTEPGENQWYDELAEAELDSLAIDLLLHMDDMDQVELKLVTYGSQIEKYDAEVALLDSRGSLLASSSPDSLSLVLIAVDRALLDSMATEDWDFDSYPNSYNIDAYENRIFDVSPLWASSDTSQSPVAYLVASFTPLAITLDEIEADDRTLRLQAVIIMLIAAAVSGLIIMAWLSRRLRALNTGVNAFRDGDLSHRIPVRSQDEIGELGRNFNAMATRLASTIEKLSKSEKFHRQLVANISHDLRTPLATVRGYVETLNDKSDLIPTQERARYLDIIAKNMDHLNHLIEHLFKLSQLDSGQVRFQLEDFQPEELVNEVLGRCEGMARENQVTLDMIVDGDIPPVLADPLQVGQAIQNLVENGIKFNHTEGKVEVFLRLHREEVEVEVRDNGEGIPQEDLPHIFERFYTADKSRTRKGQSSGLGLAIAYKILAGHDRELVVETNQEQGTSFRFTLPLATTLQKMESTE